MILKISIPLLLCSSVITKNINQKIDKNSPLNLSPLIKTGETLIAKKLSEVDPTLFAGVKSHSGFINVNETAKWNLFFWFFPVEGKPLDTTPWIIWLQGGPGGSSLFGLFEEIGPIKLVNGKAEKMPITWGSDYSLLFVDNPVGTGFSYTDTEDYVSDEDMVGACLLSFIQQFLQVFPELRKAPLFIAGESYAGKYIPAFGHYIHNKNDSLPINLKGLAIGDGWTDPPTLLHYSDWALQVGLVDPEQAGVIRGFEDKAREYLKAGNIELYSQNAASAFSYLTTFAAIADVYNYQNFYGANLESYAKFVNSTQVRRAIHVGNVSFDGINYLVHTKLQHEIYLSVKPWLEELLEHYGVMGYSGQLDVIVAYALSVHTYRSLKWSGQQDYLKAERQPILEGHSTNVIGYEKSAGNFMDVMVRNAGHMVPGDQPRAAKQIIDMFISKFSNTL